MGVIIRPRSALNNTLLVFNSVAVAIFAVIVLRLPGTGLLWAMGPLMCTRAAMSEDDARSRALALAVNLATLGAIQFVYGATQPHWLLTALAVPLAVYFTSCRRRAANSAAVIAASLTAFNQGDFLSALDTLMLMLTLALVLPFGYLLLEKLLYPGPGLRLYTAPPPAPPGALIRRMAAFTCGCLLERALNWQFGYWIVLTIGMCYVGGGPPSQTTAAAKTRMLAAPLGFFLSVVWLSTLGSADDRLNYLAVLWSMFAFYYGFARQDYLGYFLLFSVMLSGARDLVYNTSPRYGNGWTLVVQSGAAVLLGAAITLWCEADFSRPETAPAPAPEAPPAPGPAAS